MRQLEEFDSLSNEDEAKLEIFVSGEKITEDLLEKLEKLGFEFLFLKERGLRGVRKGKHDEVWDTVGRLRKLGFFWNQEVKELEEKGELTTREGMEKSKRRR